MNYLKYFLVLLFLVGAIIAEQKTLILPKTSIRVAFSPGDGVTKMITDELDKAKESIDMAAYSFTSFPIAEKLIDAHKRGVKVRIVLDSAQRKALGTVAHFLKQEGVAVHFNDVYKIQHNKYIIIDQKHVECGSFNYTKSAEKSNAENAIVILDSPEFAKEYVQNFEKLWDESIKGTKRKKGKTL